MTVPESIVADWARLAMRRAMGTNCSVHRHRELVPIERHHVWPLGDGGPNVAANLVPICANGHSSTHYYLDLIRKYGSAAAIPWRTRIRFGPKVRALAVLGWDRMQRQAL